MTNHHTPSLLVTLFLLIATSTPQYTSSLSTSSPSPKKYTIKVCQNKDCIKQFGSDSLPPTFRELLPPDISSIQVECSGCLSQCGKGPNVLIESDGGKKQEKLYFGVDGPEMASAVLEVGCDFDGPVELLAAANAILKARRASSPSKKEEILNPTIQTLSKHTQHSKSTAYAHALLLRADARLEQSNHHKGEEGALQDAKLASTILPSDAKVWRVLADAEEASGNVLGAIEAVQKWAECDGAFRTKARNELSRLSRKGC